MKLMLVLVAVCLAAVTVQCHNCVEHDASTCTHTCPTGESKACERDVCTCAETCVQVSDCPDCPSHTDQNGHQMHETKHCVDSACICMPEHMMPGGNHGPGGH